MEIDIKVPEILNIPKKLLPIIVDINKYRYFLIDGGRASGKSQSIARLIAYLCERKQLRVVCGRETQNSIEESVYTIFSDLIRQFNLNFDVSASKIDHRKTKSAIRFRGFREQGATNIKGLEGVDILWVDESQAISKETMDIIIPTIRKEKAKIFWSMNRMVENDPVFVAFANRPDCLHIHCDYVDNPFCPEAMKKEAEACKELNIDDYNHIWLGQPLKKGDDSLFSIDEVYGSSSLSFLTPGTNKRILSVDVARYGEDETVFSIVESYNVSQWQMVYQDFWKEKSTTETTGRIIDLSTKFHCDQIVIDDCGVGGGVVDMLSEMRLPVFPFNGAEKPLNEKYLNRRAEAYFQLKEMFSRRTIKILKDAKLQEQLLSIRYKYMSNGKKAIVSKDDMRKDNIKSPDRADALAMAMYFKDHSVNEGKQSFSGMPTEYAMSESL